MSTSLEIQTLTSSDKKKTKKISYVNSDVTNAQLKTFSQALVALTTDTYTDADRITETSVNDSDKEKAYPTLALGEWTVSGTTYSATITYDGDGTLSTSLGTISGSTLSITDDDGTFSGTITATGGANYYATSLQFSRNQSSVSKSEPTLAIGEFDSVGTSKYRASITYNGDGTLYANVTSNRSVCIETQSGNKSLVLMDSLASGQASGTVYAAEGTTYAAKSIAFTH